MTREEAIFYIKELQKIYASMDKKVSEAVDMAIEALTQDSRKVTQESTQDLIPSAEAVQVTGKLKNPCDSLLTDNSGERKEQKSKLESAEVAPRIDHDREWIIGCIEHDGFIHTHRFDKANQIIHDALSAEAVQEWIPCSERLPEEGKVVLITNGKGNVRCGQYRSEYDVRDGTHYWWWKGKTVESVLAWMPLPEPYKGGDDK